MGNTAKGIEWDELGNPKPIGLPIRTAESQNALARATAALPYIPHRLHSIDCNKYHAGREYNGCFCPLAPGEDQYVGKSCDEVAWMRRHQIAAQGDFESHKFAHEAIAGKPKQQQEISANVTVTLKSFLQTLAEKTKAKAQEASLSIGISADNSSCVDDNIIDVTPTILSQI